MTEQKQDDGKPENGKVVFTPEQQSKLQELIDFAYRKAYAKASEAATSKETEALKAEVERLRPLAETAQGLEKERARLADERRELSIRLALSKHPVIDPDGAVTLISQNVGWRDGRPVIYGPDSEPALDEAGTELTLDEYVEGFLEKKSYLLGAAPKSGAGSHGGGPSFLGSGTMRRAAFDSLSPREKLRHIKDGMKIADD